MTERPDSQGIPPGEEPPTDPGYAAAPPSSDSHADRAPEWSLPDQSNAWHPQAAAASPALPDSPAPYPPVIEGAAPEAPSEKRMERPSPLSGLAKSWLAVFAFIIPVGREFMESGFDAFRQLGPFATTMAIVVGAIALLSLTWGFIEWATTRFVADSDEFRIERNFLSKDSRRISYAKIQSVDIQRPLIARLLGLAGVSIDVGGEDSTKLEFLSSARADALRDHLLRSMRSLSGTAPAGSETRPHPPGHDPGAAAQQPAQLLLAVKPSTLVLGALVSNFLPMLVVFIGFMVLSLILRIGTVGFALPALLGIVSYLGSRVIGNLNFRIERVPDGLRISKGWLNTSTRSLKADRIQAVAIRQDALQRLTGLYRMNVTVLGGGILGNDAETTSVVLPYGSWRDVKTVLAAFWPGIDIESINYDGQPDRARWLTPLAFKNHRWGYDDNSVIASRGWLNTETAIVPHRRMQSISAQQGPLQRLLRLASLAVHTTTGPVSMRIEHLDASDARRLLEAQVDRARQARDAPGEPSYLTAFAPPEISDRRPELPSSPWIPGDFAPPRHSDRRADTGPAPGWSHEEADPSQSAEPPPGAPNFAPAPPPDHWDPPTPPHDHQR